MDKIKQETDHDCMLACLAALTDQPLDVVKALAISLGLDPESQGPTKPYTGLTQFDLQTIAEYLGYALVSQPFEIYLGAVNTTLNENTPECFHNPRAEEVLSEVCRDKRILIAGNKLTGKMHAWAVDEQGNVLNPKTGFLTSQPRRDQWEYLTIIKVFPIRSDQVSSKETLDI